MNEDQPAGNMVTIEHRTVVFINGGSGPIEGWYKTFHEIAKETTVVAYNRLGVGGSDKPSAPQHGHAIVTALRQLIQEVNIHPHGKGNQ